MSTLSPQKFDLWKLIRLATDVPLEEKMTQPTGGAIKPIQVTKQEKKAVEENHHGGAVSSLWVIQVEFRDLGLMNHSAEKISNALGMALSMRPKCFVWRFV